MEVKFRNDKYQDTSLSITDADSENEVNIEIEDSGSSIIFAFGSTKELDDFIGVAQLIRDRFAVKIGGEMRYEDRRR